MVSFIRTLIMYTFVIATIRVMGKRQIGELQPYELVIALMISDLAALPMQDTAIPLLSGIIPILSLLLAQLTISFVLLKSQKARNIICGKKKTIIQNGQIVENILMSEMYNIDDLLEALRIKGFFDIADVNLAILENNGELSVLPFSKAEPVKREDMNITAKEGNIIDLIIDGTLIEENLDMSNVRPKDLLSQIKKVGGTSVKDVLYCSINTNGEFWIQLRSRRRR
ncbi:MAG TPA: DUF421 domain-containing protein [Clostridiaceae bacterium]|jgi:uncharacterized membrane protein YcaP (DUF421 family)|nr:DUF421 domain-containing protein [Clostridiaceae bacterium]HOA82302.1 DUF421 domain-containing protein [Defluviitaleaceae bacterium]